MTADHLLVIDHGKLVMETSTAELIDRFQRNVVVRSPRRSGLAKMLTAIGATVRAESGGRLSVTGLDSWRIAAAAAEHHIPIQELILRNRSVEDFYVELMTGTKVGLACGEVRCRHRRDHQAILLDQVGGVRSWWDASAENERSRTAATYTRDLHATRQSLPGIAVQHHGAIRPAIGPLHTRW